MTDAPTPERDAKTAAPAGPTTAVEPEPISDLDTPAQDTDIVRGGGCPASEPHVF
jgi:hypothetical protein